MLLCCCIYSKAVYCIGIAKPVTSSVALRCFFAVCIDPDKRISAPINPKNQCSCSQCHKSNEICCWRFFDSFDGSKLTPLFTGSENGNCASMCSDFPTNNYFITGENQLLPLQPAKFHNNCKYQCLKLSL